MIDVLSAEKGEVEEGSTKDLRGVEDEKELKEVKMGSTGIRRWIREQQGQIEEK